MRLLLVTAALGLFVAPKIALAGKSRVDTSKQKHRLNIYSVKTTGALTSWRARDRLRGYRETALKSCSIPSPEQNRRDLRGEVSVRVRLETGGRLKILQIKATRQHQSLVACLKNEIATWQLSVRGSDAGSEVSFKLYISFPSSGSAGVLGTLSKPSPALLGALTGTSSPGSVYGVGGLGLRGTGRGRSGGGYGYYRSRATMKVVHTAGAINRGTVEWAVKQMGLENEVRYCHGLAAKRDPAIKGAVTIKLRINPIGAVERLEVRRATIKDAELQHCLLRTLMRKTYPPGKDGTSIELELDLPRAEKG